MRKPSILLLFLLLALLPVSASAQTIPITQGALDYVTWGTSAIDDLVTSHMDIFVADGFTLLNVLAVLILTMKGIGWMFRGVSIYHSHFDLADLIQFLGKLAAALIMLHYYNNPLPGVNFNFHQIFSRTARSIAGTIDLSILNNFLQQCIAITQNVQKPSLSPSSPWPLCFWASDYF
jgi:type IV secretion system protein VirB6